MFVNQPTRGRFKYYQPTKGRCMLITQKRRFKLTTLKGALYVLPTCYSGNYVNQPKKVDRGQIMKPLIFLGFMKRFFSKPFLFKQKVFINLKLLYLAICNSFYQTKLYDL